MSKHQATDSSMTRAKSDKQVANIFTVAPVLKDWFVSSLMKENSELKLKIFFFENGPGQLSLATRQANIAHPDRINCGCRSCIRGARETDVWGDVEHTWPCEFQPWFEDRLEDCGLTYSSPTMDDIAKYMANPFHEATVNEDVHLINCSRGDWCDIRYGKKIMDAKSVNDPELAKIVQLFASLCPDVDDVEPDPESVQRAG